MDDIYGELDNYNDVNIVEELKSENKELKTKLDEYTVAMDTLQKEFDHLSTEFKKLEMNYSSLLKTAKSEIQRKTQMITSLNLEKDKMVLNAIQNKNIKPRNLLKKDVPERSNSKEKKTKHENNDEALKKKYNPTKENVENIRIPTMDTVSSSNTDISIKSLECQVSIPKDHNKNLEFKEKCESAKVASSKIRLRRKSMPAIRHEDFSSLSGEEDSFLTKNYIKEDKPKKSNKVESETSSFDGKYSNYKDSSVETYHRSRHSKHYESDRYQSRKNTYDADRYKRESSPDYLRRRATRNCTSSQYSEYRYSETKYGHRSRSRDPRINYDKQYDDRQSFSDHRTYDRQAYRDGRDDPLYRHGYSDRLPGKHKSHCDYDNYSAKRMKTDEANSRRGDKVWQMDNNYTDEELFQKVIGDIQYTSCQSPDLMPIEYPTQETVKEIRLTSDSLLEDPRLKCAKYSLKSDDGTGNLVSINEQKIDLIPIDKSAWNILNVPDALKKLPDQTNIDVRKNDRLVSSVLTESAKSPAFDDNLPKTTSRKVNMVDMVQARETDSTNNLISPETNPKTMELSKECTETDIKAILRDVVSKKGSKIVENNFDKQYLPKQSKSRKCSEKSYVDQTTQPGNQSKNQDSVGQEVKATETDSTNNSISPETNQKTMEQSKEGMEIDIKAMLRDVVSKKGSKIVENNSDKQYLPKQPKSRKCSEKSYVDQTTQPVNQSKNQDSVGQVVKATETDSTNNSISPETNQKTMELSKEGMEIDMKAILRDVVSKKGSKIVENNSDKQYLPKQPKSRKCSEKSYVDQTTQPVNQSKNQDSVGQALLKTNCDNINRTSRDNMPSLDPRNNLQLNHTTTNKKLTNREIVAGDLELSDETSDTTDFDLKQKFQKRSNQKASSKEVRKHEKSSIVNLGTVTKDDCQGELREKDKTKVNMDIDQSTDADKQLSKNKTENVLLSVNSAKITQSNPKHETLTNETVHPRSSENEKSEGTDLKIKDDGKKKTKKTKPIVSKKTTKAIEPKVDKKKKPIKEKECVSTPIKNKFTDLFGENSSLITPEDLGLTASQPEMQASAYYVPLSEDAQDAMDIVVSVEELACDQKEIQKEVTDTVNAICTQGSSHEIRIDTEGLDHSKPTTSLNDKDTEKANGKSATIIPEPEEPLVVKTVIISTGVQPQTNLKTNLPLPIDMEINRATIDAVNSLKALATSTPHKSFFEEGLKNVNSSSNSSDSRTSSNTNIANDQSSKSISEAKDDDIPDVRIILKRKRRFKK